MGSNYKRQRRRWWHQDHRCRSCGVPTILPEDLAPMLREPGLTADDRATLRDRMATIGHAHGRLHPRRLQGGPRRLLCHACNQRENEAEQRAMPLDELWRRSGAYPEHLGLPGYRPGESRRIA